MKRTQEINGLEFTLEALSQSLVEVAYREQVGWFGVNLDGNGSQSNFAWTNDIEARSPEGLSGAIPVDSPDQALQELADCLVVLQTEIDEQRANDSRNMLGAFLESLPDKQEDSRNMLGAFLESLPEEPGSRSDAIPESLPDEPQNRLDESVESPSDEQDKKSGGLLRFGRSGLSRMGEAGKTIKDRASQGREALSEKASQSRDAIQERIVKANLPEKRSQIADIFVTSRQCENSGHDFDEVKLIGKTGSVPRFCKRCRKMIRPNAEEQIAGEQNVEEPNVAEPNVTEKQ